MAQFCLDSPGIFAIMKLQVRTEMKSSNFIPSIRMRFVPAVVEGLRLPVMRSTALIAAVILKVIFLTGRQKNF